MGPSPGGQQSRERFLLFQVSYDFKILVDTPSKFIQMPPTGNNYMFKMKSRFGTMALLLSLTNQLESNHRWRDQYQCQNKKIKEEKKPTKHQSYFLLNNERNA